MNSLAPKENTRERHKINNINNRTRKELQWKYVQCAKGTDGNLPGVFREGSSEELTLNVTCRMSKGLPDGTVGRASQGRGTCVKLWLSLRTWYVGGSASQPVWPG